MAVRRWCALAVVLAAGCGDDSGTRATQTPAAPAFAIEDFAVTPASGARPDPVLIAGETVRVDARIVGGRAPYVVEVLGARERVAEQATGAWGTELAIQAAAPARLRPIRARIRDADGATATSRALAVDVLPPGDERDAYARGERVVAKTADGELPLEVPRLAPPGTYQITVGGVETELRVTGAAFPAATALAIDDLALYGGDGRAPRLARVRAGETLRIEARVAGADGPVTGTARLRDRTGTVVATASIGETAPAQPQPEARFFVTTELTVPPRPGRYVLDVEVTRGDDIAQRSRELVALE